MRDVPNSISATWADGLFVGDRRPIARVTVQHPKMYLRNFSLMTTFTENVTTNTSSGTGSGSDDTIITCDCDSNGDAVASVTIDPHKGRKVNQTYADFLFTGGDHELPAVTAAFVALFHSIPGITTKILSNTAHVSEKMIKATLQGYLPGLTIMLKLVKVLSGGNLTTLANFKKLYADKSGLETPLELPNVLSVQWERSIGQDAGDCTIVCWNTKPLAIGESPIEGDLDLPGYYTYSRGGSNFSSQWDHTRNPWFGMLVPDNLIRTYEGYGFDATKCPEKDPHLIQTGVWMIDTVEYNTDGTLTIKARDLSRLLLEQQYYPPVVPDDFYDLDWSNWDGDFPIPGPAGGVKLKVKAQDSSNTTWIGNSLTNSVAGHKLQYAFDGHPSTYWLSIGNDRPSRRFAYEWVQCSVNNQSVNKVRFRTKKKSYTYYVSVKVGGVWQGANTMNYHEDGIGHNGADIAYVATGNVPTEEFITVTLPTTYKKVQSVRVTLGNLQNFRIGTYHYRGAFRDVEVYGPAGTSSKKDHYTKGPIGSNPGHYQDYTDLVKLICAWAGFFWPLSARQRFSDGTYHKVTPATYDEALGKDVRGRVWGDFQKSGTNGPTSLDRSTFDKRPLMDFINSIRDTLGFIFLIDESGGVQWRQPNVHNFGMWRTVLSPHPKYLPGQAHDISEESVLMSLGSTIDSKNVRESFYVGDLNGKVSAFAPGFNPNPTGIRRIAGWTDANFAPETDKNGHSTRKQLQDAITQCQVMADMISLRQLFTYRIDRVRIPANPAIQVDDQVKITERISEESYVHYVNGISSNLDMSSGEWTYDLSTYWLGQSPDTVWLYNPHSLDPATQDYIKTLNEFVLDQNDQKNLDDAARVVDMNDTNRGT